MATKKKNIKLAKDERKIGYIYHCESSIAY